MSQTNLKNMLDQMETYLTHQLEKCTYYKTLYDEQGNTPLVKKFETLLAVTAKDFDTLRKLKSEGRIIPSYKFERLKLSCMPVNLDVKEKELQLVVKTTNLPVAEGAQVYVVAEFEFPIVKDDNMFNSMGRWMHTVRIDPRNFFCYSDANVRQLDMIHSTNSKPFHDLESRMTEYDRPIQLFVGKSRSKTLKRKFKPIKLTFYEKTSLMRCDKRLGTVQVKINGINDEATLVSRLPIVDSRKPTEAMADIKVKVREPLINKSIRVYEEKMLMLV